MLLNISISLYDKIPFFQLTSKGISMYDSRTQPKIYHKKDDF